MKAKNEIIQCKKELELNREEMYLAETSNYEEEFINKGWIEALNWVLEQGKYG
tara:strand:+ start:92 stop:250 length:159 start_codon:yes stop_codon:yes gene_type:complete